MRAIPVVAAALSIAACLTSTGNTPFTITGSGRDLDLAPRPEGCTIEFFRTREPERAYDEVATVHYQSTGLFAPRDAAGVQEEFRRAACGLGADAVIITRDFAAAGQEAMMTGTAVSYRDARAGHRRSAKRAEAERRRAAALRAERAAAEAKAASEHAARSGLPRAPAGWLPATVRSAAIVRAFPDRKAQEGEVLAAGTSVWVSRAQSNGHRRVWCGGAVVGWVESDTLDVAVAPAPAAPAPPPSDEEPEAPNETEI
jgi:hypothetical protein